MNMILLVSSILFIISLPVGLFTGNMIFFAVCTTLYVLSVALSCYRLWKKDNIFHLISEHTYDNAVKAANDRKYITSAVNMLVVPVVVVGILMIVLALIVLWVDVL